MVASQDRFINKRVIIFLPKQSRLVIKISGPVFECLKNKMAKKPLENQTICPVFECLKTK